MRQRLRIMKMGCLAALLVAGAMIACAAPATAQDACALDFPLDSNPTSITPNDICNFHQVDAQLYRGGRPRASAYPKLAEVGIRTIIDLEEKEYADAERQAIDNLNRGLPPEKRIRFISCPIDSAEIEEKGIPGDHLKSIFKQMQEADKPIFIHCYHGKDRTSAIVVLYRLVMNQKSAEEAYQEAYHYLFSQADHGLARSIEQYRTPKKLKSLPRPVPAP